MEYRELEGERERERERARERDGPYVRSEKHTSQSSGHEEKRRKAHSRKNKQE